MKIYWFKAKKYGWGWYPSSWQGWLIILAYCIAIIKIFVLVDGTSHSGSDTLNGALPIAAALTIFLIFICYRTGEKPEWRWGSKTKQKKQN